MRGREIPRTLQSINLNMKTIQIPLMLMLLLCVAAACSSKEDSPEFPMPVVADVSVLPEVDDAAAVKEITLTFSEDIEVMNPGHSLLVNTTTNSRTPLTAGTVDANRWTFSAALDFDSEYELKLAGTSVKGKASGKFVAAWTYRFSTKAYEAPGVNPSDIQPLVNSNATPMAKKVHEFLKSQYGSKSLSGAMANVNNNNDFADWIFKVSGKYPAITFYDLIHIQESGQNWINYMNIDPAKSQWEANGLVGYGWHWRVPAKEGDKESSFEANNVFDIDAALTPGTWQNKVVEADVKKVADVLKKLQDNNIAILWRPLHEAAGDYKWGAWFWWGAQGLEKTKKLWIWLYDKLTNEYKLNNLIWVWTVQLYREGKLTGLADLQGAYPGDQYVDIVGPDVYNPTHEPSPEFFNAVQALVGGRKIVAMPECGMLPDIAKSFQQGAPWSYVMLWYTYDQHKKGEGATDEFGNLPSDIKAWMNDPYTLTRDQMPNLRAN